MKINQEEQEKIKNIFQENLQDDVYIQFFSEDDCEYCQDTRELLEEVAALDDRINLTVAGLDSDTAEKHEIDRAPATIFVDENGNDLNVHFYGIPSGYEFNTLLEEIIEISNGGPELDEDLKERIKNINTDVLIQVFVTPTCPYCPRAVRAAHQIAMVNPKVRAEMIESIEFGELADKYTVSGVPKTVINEGKAEQVGSVPTSVIVDKIYGII